MSSDVTVVVPCRDGARFLAEALTSVIAQGERIHEVLVVDDGSTDASAEVARALGARVLPSEGTGPASARNTGVRAAGTPWIAFLDADDVWPPESLAARFAAIAEAELCQGAVARLEQPHASLGPVRLPGAVLMTREVWDRVGPLSEARLAGYMLDWWDRATSLGIVPAVTESVVLLRRHHDDNLTVRHDPTDDYLAWARAIASRRRAT